MNCLATSADLEPLVSRNSIREETRKALRLFVGRGRHYTVKELSNGAGIKDRVIEAAMCDPDDPEFRPLPLEALASIAAFLKAPFASAFLESSGLGAFELMDGQPPLPRILASAESPESPEQERKRLVRRLAELDGLL